MPALMKSNRGVVLRLGACFQKVKEYTDFSSHFCFLHFDLILVNKCVTLSIICALTLVHVIRVLIIITYQ